MVHLIDSFALRLKCGFSIYRFDRSKVASVQRLQGVHECGDTIVIMRQGHMEIGMTVMWWEEQSCIEETKSYDGACNSLYGAVSRSRSLEYFLKEFMWF